MIAKKIVLAVCSVCSSVLPIAAQAQQFNEPTAQLYVSVPLDVKSYRAQGTSLGFKLNAVNRTGLRHSPFQPAIPLMDFHWTTRHQTDFRLMGLSMLQVANAMNKNNADSESNSESNVKWWVIGGVTFGVAALAFAANASDNVTCNVGLCK